MKPNVLFLVLDGFRSDLCQGEKKTSITPNIDKLIKNGIYFKQAISSGMGSTASVSSILTSLYPFEAQVQDGSLFKINPNIRTFVDELKDNGYYTHAIIQKPLGEEELRAIFRKETATIIINSDFPTVKKFKSEGKYNSPHFILYLREVALTELAIAVTQILDQKPEYSNDTQTALSELRLRINDYSLKFHGI